MRKVIALIGPSGAGKTSLVMAAAKRMPDRVSALYVLTDRAPRGTVDDAYCRFTTAKHIHELRDQGELVQYLEYAGHTYGCPRVAIESPPPHHCLIHGFVETAVEDIRRAGYLPIPVRVVPLGEPETKDELRRLADRERAKIPVDYALTILNPFWPGGFERAVKTLLDYITANC